MSDARYRMVCKSGFYEAEVSVSWQRKYGRCDVRRHTKHTTLYTQKALKAWARRNKVDVPQSDIDKLPKEI